MISLYIHIPFCKSKCNYCDFLSFPCKDYIYEYEKALINEINAFDTDESVRSIFIGGGTPSYIDESVICRIMEALGRFNISENAEITIEANPGTLSDNKLKAYRKYGINRISMGLQAWQDSLLKTLGRIHTRDEFVRNYHMAEKYFDNINVDVMFSLPGQTFDMWMETLENVTQLKPKHISAYSLIVEEGTPFCDMQLELPDENTDRKMYHRGIEYLKSKGYDQYEISNFAIKGYESKHNIVYWKRGDYKGFGLGASSLVGNVRYKNTENLKEYLKGTTICEKEILTLEDEMAEFMFLGLRMNEGVSLDEFESKFDESIVKKYASVIYKFKEYIVIDKGRMYLTTDGMDISNMIFSEMI